ncbi:MAG: hypothetical protein KDD01_15640 [Phaeodactylibacter sp.]|nr:hypothetical protein [Phaeodactylibacter sp.]
MNAQNYDYLAAISRRTGPTISTGTPATVNAATNLKRHDPFGNQAFRTPPVDIADNAAAWAVRAGLRAESEGNVLRARYGVAK